MLAAILTLSGPMMTLTSCSNEEDNPVNPTTEDLQIKEFEAQLLGSWTYDLDFCEELDLEEMRLTFDQDKKMTLGCCMYDYETDEYFLFNFHGTYRVLPQQTRGGVEVNPVERKLDINEWRQLEENIDPAILVDTMYVALRGDQIVIPAAAVDDKAPLGYDVWFSRGITDTKDMDKATAHEFIENARKAMEEAGVNPREQGVAAREITVKMPMRVKSKSGRELSKWMNSIPNDRKVCRMMIPGTHDAGTFGLIDPWQKTLAKTQFYDWEDQFEYGIRAFDIRTRYTDGENYIFHSMMNCGKSLAGALEDICDILKENPTEGLILFIKAEGNDAKLNWDKDALECLTWLAGSVPLSLNFSQLDKEKTTRETVKLVKETLLKEGLLAKFDPDMTMKDLRGKALVVLENAAWKADNSVYNDLRDYIAIAQDNMFVSPSGASAVVKEQNEWCANSGEKVSAFAQRKSGLFKDKYLMSVNNPDKNWWYFNAANCFINEMKVVPDYLTCASWTYPKLIDIIKANKGGSAIIVQDYAGKERLVRVPAGMLVGTSAPAALVSAVGGFIESSFRTAANKVLEFFGFKFRFTNNFISVTTVAIVYGFSESFVPSQDSHGQELVETVVDSNFE